ncbi:MAG: DUF1549 domain-containing protein, partial [Acidobacteria bacterium]|nr:DUF1549 domain-containing protein [Acidobacteriota bacterium]
MRKPWLGWGMLCALGAAAQPEPSLPAAARIILERNCAACHGAAKMSGLDLRTRSSMLAGGKRGPAIVAGRPEESLLLRAVIRAGELQMPPGRAPLPPGEVEILRRWIAAGAGWDAAGGGTEAGWWSFRKLRRPAVPEVRQRAWVRNPIDAFLLAGIEKKGLRLAPAADRRTLIRRAYFDLTGLPPAPERVEAFVNDPSPDAYRNLVEELLASPRYGERWARHWLDVVRYADSGGFETDLYLRHSWRYRDYVIQSFHQDKPYDRFVQEQIAADEIWPDDLALEGSHDLAPEKIEHLEARLGTAMYTFGAEEGESNMQIRKIRHEKLTDWVDTTGAAFLGLTVGCARCHDHKFDPFPQRDYYRLQAIFAATVEQEIPVVNKMQIRARDLSYWRILRLVELRTAHELL